MTEENQIEELSVTPLKQKSTRIRSIAYPSISLDSSFKLVQKIHQVFGSTTFNTREEISKQLKISVGYLLTQISTCVQHNLLELRNGEGYKPSQLFTIINNPYDESERVSTLISCFLHSDLYTKLVERFNNQSLPSVGGLSTILIRNYKVSETGALTAAKIFLENIEYLNLKDEQNILRVNINHPNTESHDSSQPVYIAHNNPNANNLIESKTETITYVPEALPIDKVIEPNRNIIPIYFKDGRMANVDLPEKFSDDDLQKIVKVLNAYID